MAVVHPNLILVSGKKKIPATNKGTFLVEKQASKPLPGASVLTIKPHTPA
jgi:hypothetical protein